MYGIAENKLMWIDVNIPYDEKGRLALAYNRALEQGSSEWVLFLDHDVFLCNPFWYEMCLEAVRAINFDSKVAFITCKCGGEHHARTMRKNGVPTDKLEMYITESETHYHQYGNMLQRVHEPAAGFFMLLNRKIAKQIGFVQQKESINNIDQDFGDRLLSAGYHIYLMPGLYIYHRRGMKHLKKEFKIQK